jgi:hypothetical protein
LGMTPRAVTGSSTAQVQLEVRAPAAAHRRGAERGAQPMDF